MIDLKKGAAKMELGLDQITKKAFEYLKDAGHPATFISLRNAKRESDGGWTLTFDRALGSGSIEIKMGPDGKLLGFTTDSKKG